MLSGRTILLIHEELPTALQEEGFDAGDLSLLEDPYEHMETIHEPLQKAAFLWVALIGLHVFKDGNKRTASIAMQVLPMDHDVLLEATDKDLAEVSEYIQAHLKKYPMSLPNLKMERLMSDHVRGFLGGV
ncbi:MAG: Fic family protein, partial [Thermoplasmata archaeon]